MTLQLPFFAAVGLMLVTLSSSAAAANDTTLNRLLRRDIIFPRGPISVAFTEMEFTPTWEFDTGLSYTDPDGPGRTWETPLSLAYKFTPNDSVKFSTGYIRDNDGAKWSNGADDFGLRYTHSIDMDKWSASFSIGVVAPAGGSVGSSAATQSGQAIVGYSLSSAWSISGILALKHYDRSPANVDSIGKRFALLTTWSSDPQSVSLNLIRDERNGRTGVTTAELEYDFPIGKKLVGSLTADRGLTSSHHNNALEFDIAYQFH